MKLSTEELRHIALLARIHMDEEEVEEMRGQLSNILEQFEILNQIDTEEVEPTGHAADVESVMREDEVSKSNSREDVLYNAPRVQEGFVKVEAVLDQD